MAATTVEELRRLGERLRPKAVTGGIPIYERLPWLWLKRLEECV
jgi:hypothetical protein